MKPRGLERSRFKGATSEAIDIYFTELERKRKKSQNKPHRICALTRENLYGGGLQQAV